MGVLLASLMFMPIFTRLTYGQSDASEVSGLICLSDLDLSVSDLYIGEFGLATVTECTPGELVYILYSRRGYGTYFVSELNVTLDLRHPILAGSSVADQTGRAIVARAIGPDLRPGHLLWIQAAEWGRTSNVVETMILQR